MKPLEHKLAQLARLRGDAPATGSPDDFIERHLGLPRNAADLAEISAEAARAYETISESDTQSLLDVSKQRSWAEWLSKQVAIGFDQAPGCKDLFEQTGSPDMRSRLAGIGHVGRFPFYALLANPNFFLKQEDLDFYRWIVVRLLLLREFFLLLQPSGLNQAIGLTQAKLYDACNQIRRGLFVAHDEVIAELRECVALSGTRLRTSLAHPPLSVKGHRLTLALLGQTDRNELSQSSSREFMRGVRWISEKLLAAVPAVLQYRVSGIKIHPAVIDGFPEWPVGEGQMIQLSVVSNAALKIDDGDNPSPVILTKDFEADEPLPSKSAESLCSLHLASAYANHRSLMPYSWSLFNDFERELLKDALRGTGPNIELTSDASRAGIAAITALGSPSQGGDVIDLKHPCRSITISRKPDTYQPPDALQHLYREPARQLALSLTGNCPRNASGELNSDSAITPSAELRKALRLDLRLRFSPARAGKDLAGRIVRDSGDRDLARAILANPADVESADHYVLFRNDYLQEQLGLQNVRPVLDEGDGVGSAGVPDMIALQKRVVRLVQRIRAFQHPRAAAELFEQHNLYTAYKCLLDELGTTHRLVIDQFHSAAGYFADLGSALAADKSVSPAHRTRPVILPPMSCSADQYYADHLHAMAIAVSDSAPEFSHCLFRLGKDRCRADIPYHFFVLNGKIASVSPVSLRLVLGEAWPFHYSALRHLFATELRGNAPADLIHLLLGHWSGDCAPFTKLSMVSWTEAVAAMTGPVDQLLARAGFEALPGMRLPRSRNVRPLRLPEIELPADGSLWGPDKRDRRRQQEKEFDSAELRAATAKLQELVHDAEVNKVAKTDPALKVSLDAATELARAYILDQNLSDRTRQRRLSGLSRYLRMLRMNRFPVTVTGIPARGAVHPSLIEDNTGTNIQIAILLRERILRWLTKEGFLDIVAGQTATRQKAEQVSAAILLSATVFGNLADSDRPAFIDCLIRGRVFRFDGWVWLESTNEKGIDFRWIGDAVTGAILSYWIDHPEYVQEFKNRLDYYDGKTEHITRLVRDPANSILRSLLSQNELQLHGDLTLSVASKAISDFMATQLPGVICGHIRGQLSSRVLRRDRFIRLLSGRRVQSHGSYKIENPPSSSYELPDRKGSTQRDQLRHAARLKEILQGMNDGTETNDSRRARASAVTKFLRSLSQQGAWPTTWLLGRYAQHILRHGGARKKTLVPQTMIDYVSFYGDAMIMAFGDADPIQLDGVERLEVYEDIIRSQSGKFQLSNKLMARRARRLIFFDDFLAERFGAEPADFTALDLDLPPREAFIRANMPSPEDAWRARWVLARAPPSPETLSARFGFEDMLENGVRTGETENAGTLDLFHHDGKSVRYVRRQFGTRVKTRSGTRQVVETRAAPLRMWLYRNLFRTLNYKLDNHQNALPLIKKVRGNGLGVERSHWTEQVKHALVVATGDPEMRPYDLRHYFALRQFLLALRIPHSLIARLAGFSGIESYLRACDDLRRELTGATHATVTLSNAIARQMGHSGLAVTIRHYINVLDIITAAALDTTVPKVPTRFTALMAGVDDHVARRAQAEAKRIRHHTYRDIWRGLAPEDHAPDNAPFPAFLPDEIDDPKFQEVRALSDLSLPEFAELTTRLVNGTEPSVAATRFSIPVEAAIRLCDLAFRSAAVQGFHPTISQRGAQKLTVSYLIEEIKKLYTIYEKELDRVFLNACAPYVSPWLDVAETFLSSARQPLLFRSEATRDYAIALFDAVWSDADFTTAMSEAYSRVRPPEGFLRDLVDRQPESFEFSPPIATPVRVGRARRDAYESRLVEYNKAKARAEDSGKPYRRAPPAEPSEIQVAGVRTWKFVIWLAALRQRATKA